ncbi:hypothetical protein BLNAU_4696 [Blattamonas nauphoetae]|uniref:Uncharacterized protein n=1 Tax=Blattamonas nauphoetae TaxID=2049346 RepID=A0ABQ9Y9V1_9EUKA|nr:hypothetical protein BLNAU_4696 [Blattamonas nauphoetae]
MSKKKGKTTVVEETPHEETENVNLSERFLRLSISGSLRGIPQEILHALYGETSFIVGQHQGYFTYDIPTMEYLSSESDFDQTLANTENQGKKERAATPGKKTKKKGGKEDKEEGEKKGKGKKGKQDGDGGEGEGNDMGNFQATPSALIGSQFFFEQTMKTMVTEDSIKSLFTLPQEFYFWVPKVEKLSDSNEEANDEKKEETTKKGKAKKDESDGGTKKGKGRPKSRSKAIDAPDTPSPEPVVDQPIQVAAMTYSPNEHQIRLLTRQMPPLFVTNSNGDHLAGVYFLDLSPLLFGAPSSTWTSPFITPQILPLEDDWINSHFFMSPAILQELTVSDGTGRASSVEEMESTVLLVRKLLDKILPQASAPSNSKNDTSTASATMKSMDNTTSSMNRSSRFMSEIKQEKAPSQLVITPALFLENLLLAASQLRPLINAKRQQQSRGAFALGDTQLIANTFSNEIEPLPELTHDSPLVFNSPCPPFLLEDNELKFYAEQRFSGLIWDSLTISLELIQPPTNAAPTPQLSAAPGIPFYAPNSSGVISVQSNDQPAPIILMPPSQSQPDLIIPSSGGIAAPKKQEKVYERFLPDSLAVLNPMLFELNTVNQIPLNPSEQDLNRQCHRCYARFSLFDTVKKGEAEQAPSETPTSRPSSSAEKVKTGKKGQKKKEEPAPAAAPEKGRRGKVTSSLKVSPTPDPAETDQDEEPTGPTYNSELVRVEHVTNHREIEPGKVAKVGSRLASGNTTFNYRRIVFMGDVDPLDFYTWAEENPVIVDLHDRDRRDAPIPKSTEDDTLEKDENDPAMKWRSLVGRKFRGREMEKAELKGRRTDALLFIEKKKGRRHQQEQKKEEDEDSAVSEVEVKPKKGKKGKKGSAEPKTDAKPETAGKKKRKEAAPVVEDSAPPEQTDEREIVVEEIAFGEEPFGQAQFSLTQLFGSGMKTFTFRAPVIPSTQQASSKTNKDDTAEQNDGRTIIPAPPPLQQGLYVEAQTEAKVHVRLVNAMPRIVAPVREISRIVLLCPFYDARRQVRALMDLVYSINTEVLDVQGPLPHALSNRRLTDSEKKNLIKLPILTGFHLTDGRESQRLKDAKKEEWGGGGGKLLVLEGPEATVMKIVNFVAEEYDLFSSMTLFFDRKIKFAKRLYGTLSMDITRYCLKMPLSHLEHETQFVTNKTSTGGTSKLPPIFRHGLVCLTQIQKVNSFKDITDLHLWPTAAELTAVEKRVGGAVFESDLDLEGDCDPVVADPSGKILSSSSQKAEGLNTMAITFNTPDEQTPKIMSRSFEPVVEEEAPEPLKTQVPHASKKQEERLKRQREERLRENPHEMIRADLHATGNVIEYNKRRATQRSPQQEQMLASIRQKDEQDKDREILNEDALRDAAAAPDGNVYMYASQRYNKAEMMRKKLAAVMTGEEGGKKAQSMHMTRSGGFLSLHVDAMDEHEAELEKERQSKEKWLTQKGFSTFAEKSAVEANRHKYAPDDYTKEALTQPYSEPNKITKPDRSKWTTQNGFQPYQHKTSIEANRSIKVPPPTQVEDISIPYEDPDPVRKHDRTGWITHQGFQPYQHKTSIEANQHPKSPSQGRRADISIPYEDPGAVKKYDRQKWKTKDGFQTYKHKSSIEANIHPKAVQ